MSQRDEVSSAAPVCYITGFPIGECDGPHEGPCVPDPPLECESTAASRSEFAQLRVPKSESEALAMLTFWTRNTVEQAAIQPDWTCGVCHRMWRDMASGPVRWWAEIRGPVEVASSSNWTPPPSAVPERFRSTSVPRNLP